MTCLDELKNALLAVSPHVYHFHAHKPQAPYIVWGEDGPGDTVFANGRLVLQALGGAGPGMLLEAEQHPVRGGHRADPLRVEMGGPKWLGSQR